jgi:hypothetical protein
MTFDKENFRTNNRKKRILKEVECEEADMIPATEGRV